MAKLPTVVSNVAPDLRAFINRVREAIDGSGNNRLVTTGDLFSSGIAAPGPGNLVAKPPSNVSPPSTPKNVAASGAIQNIIVTWDEPLYAGHAYAEIWGSSTNDFSAAVQIGMTPGAIFVDAVGPSVTRYYWVRFVNVLGVVGAFNAVAGVQGVTGPAVEYLIDTLTDAALDPDSPYTKFAVRADLFYVVPEVDFNQESTPTATATGDLWYQPSSEITRTWDGSAWSSFSVQLPFIVNSSPQTINGVAVPAGVYMDAAFIKNGTITTAKIGNAQIDDAKIANLSAGKITAGFISADRIQAGSIDAKIATLDAAVIGTGVINDARIGQLAVDKLLAGTTTSQGGVTFGFGLGTSVYGIATAGYFKSSNAGTAGLAGIATNSVGVAGNTASTSSYGALFSNTYGYDSISSTYVVTGLSVAGPNFGIFTQRKSQQGASTSEGAPSTYTAAYSYLAYLDGSAHYGGKLFTTNTSGVDVRGIIAGGPTYGLTVSGGTAPFTGCHDGMMFKTTAAIAGDILVDTGLVIAVDGVTDTLTEVTLSSTINQKGAIGVFAAVSPQTPKILQVPQIVPKWEHDEWVDTVEYKLNPIYQPIVDTHNYVAINSVGEGQINVCGANGDFQVGDLIVTSFTPGKGMKQTDDIVRSSTVAKIRENVTFSSPTEVRLVSCIYMCG